MNYIVYNSGGTNKDRGIIKAGERAGWLDIGKANTERRGRYCLKRVTELT